LHKTSFFFLLLLLLLFTFYRLVQFSTLVKSITITLSSASPPIQVLGHSFLDTYQLCLKLFLSLFYFFFNRLSTLNQKSFRLVRMLLGKPVDLRLRSFSSDKIHLRLFRFFPGFILFYSFHLNLDYLYIFLFLFLFIEKFPLSVLYLLFLSFRFFFNFLLDYFLLFKNVLLFNLFFVKFLQSANKGTEHSPIPINHLLITFLLLQCFFS